MRPFLKRHARSHKSDGLCLCANRSSLFSKARAYRTSIRRCSEHGQGPVTRRAMFCTSGFYLPYPGIGVSCDLKTMS